MTDEPIRSAVGHALFGLQYGTAGGHLDPIWTRLREQRIDAGLTIKQLAARADVAPSTISRGERGYHSWLEVARKVANALDLDLDMVTIKHDPTLGEVAAEDRRADIAAECARDVHLQREAGRDE